MLYMNVEKNFHQFLENYFCKHLHARRHNIMPYNNNNNSDCYYFIKRAAFDYNEPIYTACETVDSSTLSSSLHKLFSIGYRPPAIAKLLIRITRFPNEST